MHSLFLSYLCYILERSYLAYYESRIVTSWFLKIFLLFQLDFQLPSRFNLSYTAEDENKRERPVMIHRAILGSVERMFAILLEHYKGKWPFWLSPRQAIVCSVSEKSLSYALQVSTICALSLLTSICCLLFSILEDQNLMY